MSVRTRVDGGPWSEPAAITTFSPSLPEGRHVVEAQAVDAAGVGDRSPARHVVLIDRTRPRLAIAFSRRGTSAVFRARVHDRGSGARRSSLRWSFGDGDVGRGARVTRRFGESRARRIVLTARDAAGNQSYAVRAFRPRGATAVRALRVSARASHRDGRIHARGRLVRPASLRAALRPVRTAAASAALAGPAASFAPTRVGAPVRRAARGTGDGGFVMVVSTRGLRPGAYVLELRAREAGTDLGAIRLTRRVQVQ